MANRTASHDLLMDGDRLMNPTAHEPSKPDAGVSLASGPLFIVASWRSGSSLLYALLNKHPQVALTFEAEGKRTVKSDKQRTRG